MRIEAQSKYLQSILERAEAAFACQATTLAELKNVRSEVDDLVSDVHNESYPALPHLNTTPKSGCEESHGVFIERELANPKQSLSHFAMTESSTSGTSDCTNGQCIPRFWSNEDEARLNIQNQDQRSKIYQDPLQDESEGSTLKMEEMLAYG